MSLRDHGRDHALGRVQVGMATHVVLDTTLGMVVDMTVGMAVGVVVGTILHRAG